MSEDNSFWFDVRKEFDKRKEKDTMYLHYMMLIQKLRKDEDCLLKLELSTKRDYSKSLGIINETLEKYSIRIEEIEDRIIEQIVCELRGE